MKHVQHKHNHDHNHAGSAPAIDPVCGMEVNPAEAAAARGWIICAPAASV
jgi:hypothetical protein